MNQMHPAGHYKSLYQLLVVAITLPCFLSSPFVDPRYANCTQPFNCGDTSVLRELKYPFWGINRASYCGKHGFELKCVNNTLVINLSTIDLQIIGTNPQSDKFTVVFKDFWGNLCPSTLLKNTKDTLAYQSILSIDYGSVFTNSTMRFVTILYGCPSELGHQLGWLGRDSCRINNTIIDVHFVTHTVDFANTSDCKGAISLPIPEEYGRALEEGTITLTRAIDEGFDMSYLLSLEDNECNTCVRSGGECGYSSTIAHFACYCPDKPYSLECGLSQRGHTKRKVLIIASSAGIGIVILGLLISCSLHILCKCKPIPKNKEIEDLLKNYESIGPRRYTYSNIMKMTNSFREKLGEGGYGTVFKGKLQDGRVVAIKVWKQSKGDGQEFINEVINISRTSHVNIVPLLGFCFEGHKRALIYEFMSNGSLEKFTSGKDPNEYTVSFTAHKLLEIAIGITKGLEYLHQGCITSIVHFDIKPHNILLNDEFTPKISDFGLSRPFKKKESIISVSEAERNNWLHCSRGVFHEFWWGLS